MHHRRRAPSRRAAAERVAGTRAQWTAEGAPRLAPRAAASEPLRGAVGPRLGDRGAADGRTAPSVRERVADVGLGGALLGLLGALLGEAFAGASLGGGLILRERRLARRLVALGPPPPHRQPSPSP